MQLLLTWRPTCPLELLLSQPRSSIQSFTVIKIHSLHKSSLRRYSDVCLPSQTQHTSDLFDFFLGGGQKKPRISNVNPDFVFSVPFHRLLSETDRMWMTNIVALCLLALAASAEDKKLSSHASTLADNSANLAFRSEI